MAWEYHQKTGVLSHNGHDVYRHGYSGLGMGKNNPAKESIHGMGPIPRGRYTIGKPYDDLSQKDSVSQKVTHHGLGPHVMHLTPVGHTAHGRTLFRIHGDNKTHTASHGCIILPPTIRDAISKSKDTDLFVKE
jgi:lipoprotein-anchoring transpeptidase ErfK/SrfK